MDEIEINNIVAKAYKEKYPRWKGVSVSSITKFKNGLHCVVNVQEDDYKNPFEEMCFIKKTHNIKESDVLIFSNTNELVHHIEKNSSLKNWLFSGEAIAATAFLLLLLTFIVSYFLTYAYPQCNQTSCNESIISNKDIFEILKSIFSLAAGYFLAKKF